MAEVLSEFPELGRRSPNGKSQWDRFMDGQVWKFTFKEIGYKDAKSVHAGIHRRAKHLGMKVRTVSVEGGMAVQAYKPEPDPTAQPGERSAPR